MMADPTRILYIDDEPDLLDIGKLFLEKNGDLSVTTIESAPVALSLLEKERFDAIISDYQMPVLDGIQVLIETRKHFGDIPFILFTGKGREEVVIQAINSGVDAYIQKGGDPEAQFADLSHRIRKAVERYRAKRALFESEEKFKTLFENAGDAIFVVNQSVFLDFNGKAETMFGCSRDQIIGQPFSRFSPEYQPGGISTAQMTKEKLELALSGQPQFFEWDHVRYDGTKFNAEVSLNRIMVKGTYLVQAIVRDITVRRKAEEAARTAHEKLHASYEQLTAAEEELRQTLNELTKNEQILRESEERYRQFFKTTLDSVFITSPDGRWIDFNDALVEMFGYSGRDEMAKVPVVSVYAHPEERQVFLEIVQREGYVRERPLQFRKHDGTIMDTIITIVPQRNPDGSLKAFIGTIRDVTERMRLDDALKASEERFRMIFDTMPIGIWIADRKGTLIMGNKAGQKIWGAHPRVGQKDYGVFRAWRLPSREPVRADDWALGHAVNEGKITENELLEIEAFDGSHKTILNWAAPVKNARGEIIGAFVINQDITGADPAKEEPVRKNQALSGAGSFMDVTETGQQGEVQTCFGRILESTLNEIYLFDARTLKFIDVNRYARENLGYGLDELRAMTLDEIRYNLDRESLDSLVASLNNGKKDKVVVFATHKRKDGSLYPVEVHLQLIKTGSEPLILAICLDITEHKKIEDALIREKLLLRCVIDSIPDLIFFKDPDSVYIGCNRAFEQYAGCPESALTGRTDFDLFDRETAEFFREKDLAMQKKGTACHNEETVTYPDGRKVMLDTLKTIFYDDEGKKLGLVGISRDITERKQMEDALRELGIYNRTLIEASIDPLVTISHDGRIADVNAATEKITGCSRTELIGTDFSDYFTEPDKAREGYRQVFVDGIVNEYPLEIRHRDGHVTPVQYNAIVYHGSDGSVDGVFAAARDITERRQVENALRQANRKLALLSSVTRHDLINQMTVLKGYLAVLEKKQVDPALTDNIRKIRNAAQRITAMIQFTREYEEIGASVPVWQECRKVVDDAIKDAGFGQITINNDIPEGMEVLADPLISRVCYNLIENAVRHGRTVTRVRFSTIGSNGDHLIVCEDNGAGVAPEEKEMIFTRGFGRNTGLGLFLSREILSITGITIRECGEQGKGARFEIAVPKGAYRFSDTRS